MKLIKNIILTFSFLVCSSCSSFPLVEKCEVDLDNNVAICGYTGTGEITLKPLSHVNGWQSVSPDSFEKIVKEVQNNCTGKK